MPKPENFNRLPEEVQNEIEDFVQTNPIIDFQGKAKLPLIHYVIFKKHNDLLQMICANTSHHIVGNDENVCALSASVMVQEAEMVNFLIKQSQGEHGLTKDIFGRTALHIAAMVDGPGSIAILGMVVDRFPTFINDKDSFGWTPLCYAAVSNNCEKINVLFCFWVPII